MPVRPARRPIGPATQHRLQTQHMMSEQAVTVLARSAKHTRFGFVVDRVFPSITFVDADGACGCRPLADARPAEATLLPIMRIYRSTRICSGASNSCQR